MTSTIEAPVAGGPAADAPDTAGHRLHELRTAVSRLSDNARGVDTSRVLLRVGAVATPFGLLCILLGYWGAAHAARPIEQTPYLISGGLLGLALVFAGGFAYFAHWLTRSVAQQQRMVEALNEHTDRLDARFSSLEEALSRRGGGTVAVAAQQGNGHVAPTGPLVVTPTGTTAHRPDCPVVVNRSDTHTVTAAAGMGRCKICRPTIDAV